MALIRPIPETSGELTYTEGLTTAANNYTWTITENHKYLFLNLISITTNASPLTYTYTGTGTVIADFTWSSTTNTNNSKFVIIKDVKANDTINFPGAGSSRQPYVYFGD